MLWRPAIEQCHAQVVVDPEVSREGLLGASQQPQDRFVGAPLAEAHFQDEEGLGRLSGDVDLARQLFHLAAIVLLPRGTHAFSPGVRVGQGKHLLQPTRLRGLLISRQD